ncbi:hypothetical protein [Proteus hauseri]|nr:hypothetical protein [Proteus hauseri]
MAKININSFSNLRVVYINGKVKKIDMNHYSKAFREAGLLMWLFCKAK